MVAFEPARTDIFIVGKTTGKTQRCIFAKYELSEEEKKHFDGMEYFAAENGYELPEDFMNGERKLSRYLQACKYDYQKTLDAIELYVAWIAT